MSACGWLASHVRAALFLAVCSIVCVVSDPLCQETTPFHYDQPQLTCSDFTSAQELETNVPDRPNGDKLEFVLKDSRFEYNPRSVFQKVKPSTLVLSNVTVRSYRTPNSEASVFAELRDTLEKLVFHKNSSLPNSWSLLKDNRLLAELLLFRMASLRLGQDFNELPARVRDVAVVQSTLSGVDARWLSSMSNLESLRIDKVDLEKLERSMLPRPASKLKYLTIAGTDLSALPEDFAQDMPSLEKLNLRRNKFTTFQEAALAPFKSRNVIVELEGFLGEHRASMLEFNNVTLGSFLEPGSNRSLFSGLEPSLKRVTFTLGSTLPSTWATLRPLGRLEELVFFEMTALNLTRDFNELPAGLRKVVIIRTGVGNVDNDWMSSLLNLENLRIQSSTLDRFARSMLPRPAPRLRKLTIGDSSLTSLPEDFGADFPVLKQVNLRQNLISSFSEQSLVPLKNSNATVVLSGNPVHCDCKVSFLLGYPDSWTYPECDLPEPLSGVPLRVLTAEKLGCTEQKQP
ncbi:carboxypeptidase N subunit 2 [Rhipicephalus sanguineus]|uniref:carboxypeptidase N subunit 2 n=1 Tax=Rhipicephalus sanguineus TaxID=34632 RepID=UPI0020C4A94C|nr:carboxypeptidase N subunit 2 [Rhipicephalus sanguineus]